MTGPLLVNAQFNQSASTSAVCWPGTQGGLSTTAGVREKRGAGDGWVMALPTKKVLRAANCGWPGASDIPSTGATHASLSLNIFAQSCWGRAAKAAPILVRSCGHAFRSYCSAGSD